MNLKFKLILQIKFKFKFKLIHQINKKNNCFAGVKSVDCIYLFIVSS